MYLTQVSQEVLEKSVIATELVVFGITYNIGDFVELSAPYIEIPRFAAVEFIISSHKNQLLCVRVLNECEFIDNLCAYEFAGYTEERIVVNVKHLISPWPCPFRSIKDGFIIRKHTAFANYIS